MLRAMGGARLLEAPADRPAGRRGWRGWLACAAAVAALPALGSSTYSDGPGWTGPVYLFAALALTWSAVILWTARRRAVLGLSAVMVAAAVAAGVVAESAQRREQREEERLGGATFKFDEKGPAITKAQAEAVPEGSTKDEVRAILGQAAGSGIQQVTDGRDMRCLLYNDAGHRGRSLRLFAFCFSNGRSELLIW
jgi:hypothetical protein